MATVKREAFPKVADEILVEREEEREKKDYRVLLKENAAWLTVIGFLVVVLLILTSMLLSGRKQAVAMEQKPIGAEVTTAVVKTPTTSLAMVTPKATAVSLSSVPTSRPTVDIHPVESGKFPDNEVQGPSIVQWWDGGNKCGIFMLAEGETFSYEGQGTWWRFVSQQALEARYPTHRAEYFNSNQGCFEGRPTK